MCLSHAGLGHVLFASTPYASGYCEVYAVPKELRSWPFSSLKFSKTLHYVIETAEVLTPRGGLHFLLFVDV